MSQVHHESIRSAVWRGRGSLFALPVILGSWLLLAGGERVLAAEEPVVAPVALDQKSRGAIVERTIAVFNEYYIDAAVAERIGRELKARTEAGDYREYDRLDEFAARLTQDLREWSQDLHVLITPYEPLPDWVYRDKLVGDPEDNYGFRRVEILPGNIGYLDLHGFYNVREAGPTAVAAMGYLANCRALIIDLRKNGGGDTSMSALLSSYLLGESTHLSSHYYRVDDTTRQDWSYGWVPGPRLTDVPVYILLSQLSFSCAESFAYNLQQLGRAVLVGERTRGGGHSVTYLSFPEEHVTVRVPYTRIINAVSGTGYQSVGVAPDIETSSAQALAAANVAIARAILAETGDASRGRYQWILEEYSSTLDSERVPAPDLQEYVGVYGEESVSLECGHLVYRDHIRPARTLVFLGNDLFTWRSDSGYSRYRTSFVRDESGAIVGLYVVDDDGDRYGTAWRVSE